MTPVPLKPHYQITNGVRYPSMFSPVCFREVMDYKPKPDDVFIVTYPKCGTTWMQNIALYIFQKGKEVDLQNQFFRMCPFIDTTGLEGIDNMPRPGALKTHLPYHKMPYSPEAKYIFVLRNPKDCCVSLFYHTKMNTGFGYWDATFDDFFELFMAGEVEYDDYFDHMAAWYPHRNDSQVFYTFYEDMKKDTKSVVLKLARFLGKEYIDAIEADNNVLNNFLHYSSFEYMKKNLSELYDSRLVPDEWLNDPNVMEGSKHMVRYARSLNPPPTEKLEFVRKGVVGDWKNHMSAEQSDRLNEKFVERTEGTEIFEKYKEFMHLSF